eukprot:COSAG02_NODE_5078_length_4659_cov_3.744737_3_plen_146_part_00
MRAADDGDDYHKVRGAENVGKILVGSNSPRTTSTASAEIEDAVKQSSSLKRSLSLKTAGVSSTVVANQLAEQARVAQSVNLQNTLRRTNSDFITPRCASGSLFACFQFIVWHLLTESESCVPGHYCSYHPGTLCRVYTSPVQLAR